MDNNQLNASNLPPWNDLKKQIEDEYKKQQSQKTCPNCGHCPTCGRSNNPWYYQRPFYPYWPYITWTGNDTTTDIKW